MTINSGQGQLSYEKTISGQQKKKKKKKMTILGLLHDDASRRRTIATPSVATPRDAFASLTLFLLYQVRQARMSTRDRPWTLGRGSCLMKTLKIFKQDRANNYKFRLIMHGYFVYLSVKESLEWSFLITYLKLFFEAAALRRKTIAHTFSIVSGTASQDVHRQ